MSAPWNLHSLYSLDPSSLDFLRRLYSLIRQDEEEQYLSSLQGSELARLVDFFDKVRAPPSAFCSVTNRALQTLSTISVDDDISRQCLRKLQAICAHRATLPSSYIVSDDLARVGDRPIAFGRVADVWWGTYCHKSVFIRSLKGVLGDDQTLKKVRVRCGVYLLRLLKTCGYCSRSSERLLYGKG